LSVIGLLSCKGKWHKDIIAQPPTQEEVQQFFQKRWADEVEGEGFQNPHVIIINFKQSEPYQWHYKRYGLLTTFQVKMDAVFTRENEYGLAITNEWNHFIQFYRDKNGDLSIRDNSVGLTTRRFISKPFMAAVKMNNY
jgi:hypothetical protein